MALSRRAIIAGAGAFGLTSTVSGCGIFVRPITAKCPNDPQITDPSPRLTIDSHVHVFNGSDLQVNAFFTRVLMQEDPDLVELGPILQEITWSVAPSGADERAALQRVSDAVAACSATNNQPVMQAYFDDREDRYSRGVEELNKALDLAEARAAASARGERISPSVRRAIESLPPTYQAYREKGRAARFRATADYKIENAIAFLLRCFQYRYVNVFDYLYESAEEGNRKVDLMVAHLVDYDWPIGEGESTRTPLSEQIDIMERIALLTSGRVHYFAPFDPMKEVAYRLGHTSTSPLRLVNNAINRGALGVKLYPPMGFRASRNAELDPGFWNRDWIPPALRLPDLGARLDQALGDLYAWCLREDVCLMAHTARSNAPAVDFEYLTDPEFWDTVPAGLRVNFGHFGDTDQVAHGTTRALQFARRMTAPAGSQGEFYYADSGYFADSLHAPEPLKASLRELYRATSGNGPAALAQRLMYGTDWEMTIMEGSTTGRYLRSFEAIFADLDADTSLGAIGKLSDNFFGRNAANFLGLKQGKNRDRLDAFYALQGKPLWMAKV